MRATVERHTIFVQGRCRILGGGGWREIENLYFPHVLYRTIFPLSTPELTNQLSFACGVVTNRQNPITLIGSTHALSITVAEQYCKLTLPM
jgi:hypothetical protein